VLQRRYKIILVLHPGDGAIQASGFQGRFNESGIVGIVFKVQDS
jgi:hypothetical protein